TSAVSRTFVLPSPSGVSIHEPSKILNLSELISEYLISLVGVSHSLYLHRASPTIGRARKASSITASPFSYEICLRLPLSSVRNCCRACQTISHGASITVDSSTVFPSKLMVSPDESVSRHMSQNSILFSKLDIVRSYKSQRRNPKYDLSKIE